MSLVNEGIMNILGNIFICSFLRQENSINLIKIVL